MMMLKPFFFFDSYAFIEIERKNKNYEKFEDSCFLTTKLNLFEVYQAMIRSGSKDKAEKFIEKCDKYALNIDKEIIKEAVEFRIKNKKNRVSMADCIGYCMAKRIGIEFLTGDKEFEGLDNVRFIK